MADTKVRQRIANLDELIEKAEFFEIGGGADGDLAGYTITRIVDNALNDERSRHLINIIKVEAGKGKYSHSHGGGETVWVMLKGEGTFKLDGDNEIPVKPGDFFHSYSNEIHGSTNTGNEDMYYFCVEGPTPNEMNREIKPVPYRQGRILNLDWEMEKGGFAPVNQILGLPDQGDLPGYTVKFLAPMTDPRAKHLIEIVNVDAGYKKYHHYHNNAETVLLFLQGEGEFFLDENTAVPVKAGDVAHALPGEVHGTRNTSSEKPLRYLVVEGPLPLDMNKA